MSGIYLVTVPIGNKDDITLRALELLKSSRVIYSEDTRVFKELCQKLMIDYSDKEIRSFHDHSGEKVLEDIISLADKENIVFVSDAGSPIISDPAFPLVLRALEEGVELHSYGGINSVITALELSGLAPIPFKFHGFLTREKGKLTTELKQMGKEYGTHIFFEGKSRVMNTLEQVTQMYPDFKFALARELTKAFESVYRFKGSEFAEIKEQITEKGEFVILMENNNKQAASGSSDELLFLAEEIIQKGARPKMLAKLLSEITGQPTKELYQKMTATRQ